MPSAGEGVDERPDARLVGDRLPIGLIPVHAQDPQNLLGFPQDSLDPRPCFTERLVCVGRVRRQRDFRDAEMHADDGDLVADDIMQVTGDAQPLLGNATVGLRLPLRIASSARRCSSCR